MERLTEHQDHEGVAGDASLDPLGRKIRVFALQIRDLTEPAIRQRQVVEIVEDRLHDAGTGGVEPLDVRRRRAPKGIERLFA